MLEFRCTRKLPVPRAALAALMGVFEDLANQKPGMHWVSNRPIGRQKHTFYVGDRGVSGTVYFSGGEGRMERGKLTSDLKFTICPNRLRYEASLIDIVGCEFTNKTIKYILFKHETDSSDVKKEWDKISRT